MKNPDDKLVKILLNNGMAINMYADIAAIEEVMCHPKFVRFKDDGNDNVCISLESIAGFEVLDDRTDSNPATAEEITQVPVPELQPQEQA